MTQKRDDTIYIKSHVNEIFATTEVTQYFTNVLNKPIELTVSFPIKEEINLTKFVVSIEDKIIISKVMPKEKAEEKYGDAMASGNMGFISTYKEEMKNYTVNIGNLNPKKQVELKAIFIQMIKSNDLSYEYIIMDKYPSFYYEGISKGDPKYKIIKAEFNVETQSKITRLIAPFLDEEKKMNSKYSVNYSQDYKNAIIKYETNEKEIDNYYISLDKKDHEDDFNHFSILFRTVDINKPILYQQYNPELKETSFSINYIYTSKNLKEIPIPEKPDEDNTISYFDKYEKNISNDTPGLFIFLIDQSGSMSGNPILLVRKALLLFLQSLPVNSYFQLIGFGSDFQKYNKEPVLYNKANVEYITNIINGLTANLGGTNISKPLRDIFTSQSYSKINLSKNIFMLTDGEVHDREECIKLVTNNSGKFRLHAIGIGNYFDKILIERCGKLGKGSSSFVKDMDKINSVVIYNLNRSLRSYIIDIKFDFENYNNAINSSIIKCTSKNNFTYQNEIINYSFILSGEQNLSNLKLKITGKDPINPIEASACFSDNIIKLKNGEEMCKMIVGKALKNNEELLNDEKKEIGFAKKYQILSKNTALFAQIINEQNQQSELIKVNLDNISKPRTQNTNMGMINPFRGHQMNNPWSNSRMNPMMGMIGRANPFSVNNSMGMGMNPMMGMIGRRNPFNMNNSIGMGMGMNPPMGMGMGINTNMNNFNNMNNMNMMSNMNNMNMMNNMNNMNMMNNMNNMNMQNNMNNMNMMNNMNNMNMMNNMNNMNQMSPPPSFNNNYNSMPNHNSTNFKNSICSDPDYLSSDQMDEDMYSASSNSYNEKKAIKGAGLPPNSMKTKSNDDMINLITSQDIIEGSWNENEETKKLINIISPEKFDKIKNKIYALNKGINQIKIIYTILVIYYLHVNCPEKLNDYILVINKAKKFLNNNGINYDDIVYGI